MSESLGPGKQSILPIVNIAQKGKGIAANLAIVYLVTIMEAYIKDVIYELLNQHIRRVSRQLLGDPVPTNEDEDFLIEVQLDEAEKDEIRPFHLISELSRERVQLLLRQTPVERGLKFLEKHFDIKIEGKKSHLKNWEDIKLLRNRIVHSESSPEYRGFFQKLRAQSDNESVIKPEYVIEAVAQVFEFAHAIERGIFAFKHPEKSSSERPA